MEYSPTLFFVGVIWKKKKRKQVEKKQKGGKCSSLCRDIIFIWRNTKFKQAKGTMLQSSTKCRNKEFFCRGIIEERCEENCRNNLLLYRDKD